MPVHRLRLLLAASSVMFFTACLNQVSMPDGGNPVDDAGNAQPESGSPEQPADGGDVDDDAGAATDGGTPSPDGEPAPSPDGEPAPSPDGEPGQDAGPNDGGPDSDAGETDAGGEVDAGPSFTTCAGTSAAHDTFNAFWSTMDEEYAVFPYRLTSKSWSSVGADACDAVSASMTDTQLYDLLIGMAQNLDDGHTGIEATDLGRDDDALVSVYPFESEAEGAEFVVEENYFENGVELTWAAEEWFGWGTLADTTNDIGYLSITSMDELSTSEEEDDDVDAANAAMVSALSDLGDSDGLIIDVRANGGGWDTVSLEVARFIEGPQALAWTKSVRDGPEHTDLGIEVRQNVEASVANAFDGPVVVLVSGGTFSAAETFLLAMRVRPNVTLLGERSSGHLSDLTDGSLPNGWDFTFSGERYTAADGQVYEKAGVPMDVEVGLDATALTAGTDRMLEAAIALLEQ